jgi:hypothetical protein
MDAWYHGNATSASTFTTVLTNGASTTAVSYWDVNDELDRLQREIDEFGRAAQQVKCRRPFWPANPVTTERPRPELPRRSQPRLLRVQARGG